MVVVNKNCVYGMAVVKENTVYGAAVKLCVWYGSCSENCVYGVTVVQKTVFMGWQLLKKNSHDCHTINTI